jgi:hypothetical protein
MVMALSSTCLMSSHDSSWTKPDLVRVHEAGVAHHVAAVGEVDGQHRAAAVLHGGAAVVVQLLVVVRADVAAREHFLEVLEERRVHRHHVLEVAVMRAVLDHQDLAVALDDGRLDLADLLVEQTETSFLPSRISWRASRVQVGQSESVCAASRAAASSSDATSAAACPTTGA